MLSHLILRKSAVQRDWKLRVKPPAKNNGRKVLVNEIYPDRESPAKNPEWKPGSSKGKTPVIATGAGGLEVATFTEAAAQTCHKHLRATEIYTVLEGAMRMRLGRGCGQELLLRAGDEVIVFPNTPHEVLPQGTRFLARVHAVNCWGKEDKYVLAKERR